MVMEHLVLLLCIASDIRDVRLFNLTLTVPLQTNPTTHKSQKPLALRQLNRSHRLFFKIQLQNYTNFFFSPQSHKITCTVKIAY